MNKKKQIVLAVGVSSIIILLICSIFIYCFYFFPTEIEIKDNTLSEQTNKHNLREWSSALGYRSKWIYIA